MIDRSKYKKQVSIEDIDNDLKKAQDTMKNPAFSGQGGKASFYSVAKEGRYILRVLPSETMRPYVPRKTVKLPIMCPVYDSNGEDTGKKEVRMKDVFTSDIHSDRMEGKDAVLTYLNYVYELASQIEDPDEKKKFLTPITGYRNKKQQWVWGISPSLNYVCYVYAENEIHRFDLRPQWWKELKRISVERCDDNVISVDVFSNDEKGYPLIINVNTNDKNKLEFALSCDLPKVKESWDDFFAKNAVPDEVLEALDELPKLEDMYVDVFSRKDWNMQIEGLERIDEQYKFGIFQNDKFLDELEEIEKLVPEDDEVKQATQINTRKSSAEIQKTKQEIKKSPASSSVAPTYPPLIKMKAELKEYIEREYEGTEELPSSLSVIELRKWYDLMKEGMMLPFEDYKEEESEEKYPFEKGEKEEEDDSPVEKAKVTGTSSKVSSKLQALRNRSKKN